MPASTAPIVFTVVIPCFNEEAVIKGFHERLAAVMATLDGEWEAIYVDDGSQDGTGDRLTELRRSDRHVAIVSLSRNFGKEAAMTAGLDYAQGEATIIIDADLQDPPEAIPEMVAAWRRGIDMVYGQRRVRRGETFIKRTTANLFYRLMQRIGRVHIPPNTGDFRLMSRRALKAVLQLREHHRFMKGLFAWVGYPSEAVLYDRDPRYLGETKWSYWKLWNFALEGITSFTVMPLKAATYLGVFTALLAVVYIAEIIIKDLLFGNSVAGYPSLMAVVLFLGGAQLVTLGLIGEYLGRIFNETKARPLYFIESYTSSTVSADLENELAEEKHLFVKEAL